MVDLNDPEDLRNPDMSGHDEEVGENAARDFLSQSPEERRAAFMNAPIGYMTSMLINPEEELSADVQDAVVGLNAEVKPFYNDAAMSALSGLPSDKAKDTFLSLAASYGVTDINDIGKLSMDQVNSILQNDELNGMREKVGSDRYFLDSVERTFNERQAAKDYDAKRENRLNRIWAEVEPLADKKANDLLGRNKPKQAPQYTAPSMMKDTGVNVSVNQAEPTWNYKPEEVSVADAPKAEKLMENGTTIQGEVPQAQQPVFSAEAKVDTTPGMTMNVDLENPNFNYDAIKGAEADSIRVDGAVPPSSPTFTVPDRAAEGAGRGNATPSEREPWDAGFSLSNEARDKVKEKFHKNSLWGIVEEFASAKSPEDAFMGLMVNMLLYLPGQAIKALEMANVKAEERAKYIKEKVAAHDEEVAAAKGLGAPDRFEAIHDDFIKTCGDLSAVAEELHRENPALLSEAGITVDAEGHITSELTNEQKDKLRENAITALAIKMQRENPSLLQGIELTRDENGRIQPLKPKQQEAVVKAVLGRNYSDTYEHEAVNSKMKEMWLTEQKMLKNGTYEKLFSERAAAQAAANQKRADEEAAKAADREAMVEAIRAGMAPAAPTPATPAPTPATPAPTPAVPTPTPATPAPTPDVMLPVPQGEVLEPEVMADVPKPSTPNASEEVMDAEVVDNATPVGVNPAAQEQPSADNIGTPEAIKPQEEVKKEEPSVTQNGAVDEITLNPNIIPNVNTQAAQQKIESISAKPLDARANKMSIRQAHDFSISVGGKPSELKQGVNSYLVSVQGLDSQVKSVESNRNRLNEMRSNVTVAQNVNLRTGMERS